MQKMLQPPSRGRYLKLIAVFTILKGVLLLAVGVSLIFLNSRTQLLERIGEWAGDELALVHSPATMYLLNRLQEVVAGGLLRVTGLVSLFYGAVLCTEGVGVYLQRRWAELLMICATALLIPFEAHHLWRNPSLLAAFILAANCFIVWYLCRVLGREKRAQLSHMTEREVARVR
jgi:uncharacterized membrane protein (DUF2068 family)